MCACVHWKLYNDAIIVNYKEVSVIDLVAILLFELKFKQFVGFISTVKKGSSL